jgi:hypothetical protein
VAEVQAWPVYIEDIETRFWHGVANEDEPKHSFYHISLIGNPILGIFSLPRASYPGR